MYHDFSILELNLTNCLSNYRYFRSLLKPSTKLLVLIKANAYGHGAVEFASIMQRAGANYLAVAYPSEGVELRKAGISLPILVLTCGEDYFEDIIKYKLEPGIPNIETLKAFTQVAKKHNIEHYPVHIKIDTGMHRLGFMADEIAPLCELLSQEDSIKITSIYTHLAASEDSKHDDFTLSQIHKFEEIALNLSKKIGYRPMFHCLNSAGIQRFNQYQMDMVRLGIGIYGISAIEGVVLKPVAYFKCKIIQIKDLYTEKETVGYGRKGTLKQRPSKIATIPIGYADGIDRKLGCGNISFMLNGHKVSTIGNICMDMCMLDITGVDAKLGDIVNIFGENPKIEDLAKVLETIPYEVITRIPKRIKRSIIKG